MRGETLPVVGKSPRQIWVELGNAMRAIYPDIWVDTLFEDYALSTPAGGSVLIIPDVRFPNEVKAIRERGGILVKVTAPGVPEDTDGADDVLADYDGWDFTIANDFTERTINRHAEDMAQIIKEKLHAR